ncbi:hypothetical protein BCR34DRAFT_447855, partial [Clohesyomyces aquaticus]
MAKRNSEGDVLFNRMSVGVAKGQRLLASWGGLPAEEREPVNPDQERDELADEVQGPETIGVGGIIPKDIEDGSFTRRPLTSNDRLLEQLIGKKAAKEHRASKPAPRDASNPQKFGRKPETSKREPSDDEEEGRASAFRSKRTKTNRMPPPKTTIARDDGETAVGETESPQEGGSDSTATMKKTVTGPEPGQPEEEDATSARPVKPKSGSYLDEILAERSKKKKKR